MDNEIKRLDQEVTQYYKNNRKLKAAGVSMNFSPYQIEEFVRCAEDPIYFIRNYVKIIHIDKGVIDLDLWDFQENMVRSMLDNRFSIFRLPRQCGKTTIAAAVILHYIIFNPDRPIVAILANKGSQAREILGRIKMAYEELPHWLQVGVVEWNKGSITLGNGARVIAAATGSSAVRGMSVNCLYLDEYAFVPPNIADEFFESVYPTISSGRNSKIIITSTPKGLNHFYKMYVEAEQGRSEFKPFSVEWNDIPGRDEEWKSKTIATIGQESFDQEFACTFLGSSNTLISGAALKNLVHIAPIFQSQSLKVYEEPVQGHTYFMSVDVSRGSNIDYHCAQVIDITEYPFKQVAIFHDNKTSPYVLPSLLYEVAKKYNDAFVLIETNDIGESVGDAFYHELEYDNLLTTGEVKGRVVLGSWRNGRNGVRTTKVTKREGCSSLKSLIENQRLIINDFTTIKELSTFVSRGTSYEADANAHDDCVMALVVFAWAVTQGYFNDLMDKDVRKRFLEDAEEAMMEDLSPLGFFGNAHNEDDMLENGWELVN